MGILSNVDDTIQTMDNNIKVIGKVFEKYKFYDISEFYKVGTYHEHYHDINLTDILNKIFSGVEFENIFDYVINMPHERYNLLKILTCTDVIDKRAGTLDDESISLLKTVVNHIYNIPLKTIDIVYKTNNYRNFYTSVLWFNKNIGLLKKYVYVNITSIEISSDQIIRFYITFENYTIVLRFIKRTANLK